MIDVYQMLTGLNRTALSLFLNNTGLTLTKEEEMRLGCINYFFSQHRRKVPNWFFAQSLH